MQKKLRRPGFLRSNFSFFSQFVRNPKEIGSIIPSSQLLGRAMARFVPKKEDRFVVELGPGTGPITKSLTKVGLDESNMMCIEMSPKLVAHLRKRFPNLNVVEGDASKMELLLGEKAGKVDAFVSSLPLRSIPDSIVNQIIAQMEKCLDPDGVIIQFTYDLRPWRSPLAENFKRVKSKIVVGNVPPARVDVFKKA